MITGVYDVTQGAHVTGLVYFPTVDRTLDVPFLVDTGASLTSISMGDLVRLGDETARGLPLSAGTGPMTGVGGVVPWWTMDIGLGFVHDDGGLTFFGLPVAVLSTPGIPSLLGRDILSIGKLTFDGTSNAVSLEVAKGVITVPTRG